MIIATCRKLVGYILAVLRNKSSRKCKLLKLSCPYLVYVSTFVDYLQKVKASKAEGGEQSSSRLLEQLEIGRAHV